MTVAERRYANYSRAYDRKAAELAEYGAKMSSPKLTPGQYKDIYRSASVEFASSKNIPKKIVEQQAREYSPAQARARARAFKQAGLISSAAGYGRFKYAEGVNKDFDIALSKRYAELKAEGKMSKNEIRELLGIEFFYSDEDELDD